MKNLLLTILVALIINQCFCEKVTINVITKPLAYDNQLYTTFRDFNFEIQGLNSSESWYLTDNQYFDSYFNDKYSQYIMKYNSLPNSLTVTSDQLRNKSVTSVKIQIYQNGTDQLLVEQTFRFDISNNTKLIGKNNIQSYFTQVPSIKFNSTGTNDLEFSYKFNSEKNQSRDWTFSVYQIGSTPTSSSKFEDKLKRISARKSDTDKVTYIFQVSDSYDMYYVELVDDLSTVMTAKMVDEELQKASNVTSVADISKSNQLIGQALENSKSLSSTDCPKLLNLIKEADQTTFLVKGACQDDSYCCQGGKCVKNSLSVGVCQCSSGFSGYACQYNSTGLMDNVIKTVNSMATLLNNSTTVITTDTAESVVYNLQQSTSMVDKTVFDQSISLLQKVASTIKNPDAFKSLIMTTTNIGNMAGQVQENTTSNLQASQKNMINILSQGLLGLTSNYKSSSQTVTLGNIEAKINSINKDSMSGTISSNQFAANFDLNGIVTDASTAQIVSLSYPKSYYSSFSYIDNQASQLVQFSVVDLTDVTKPQYKSLTSRRFLATANSNPITIEFTDKYVNNTQGTLCSYFTPSTQTLSHTKASQSESNSQTICSIQNSQQQVGIAYYTKIKRSVVNAQALQSLLLSLCFILIALFI